MTFFENFSFLLLLSSFNVQAMSSSLMVNNRILDEIKININKILFLTKRYSFKILFIYVGLCTIHSTFPNMCWLFPLWIIWQLLIALFSLFICGTNLRSFAFGIFLLLNISLAIGQKKIIFYFLYWKYKLSKYIRQ